jgi:adenylate kinase family enzyme
VLTARDPLPGAPQRILVAGTSGSGKTTLAGRIAAMVGAPHTEIDALYHGPDWTPRGSFLVDAAAFVAQPTWVTEWQYGKARPILLRRADLLVWLDLPRAVVMRRVLRRTAQRRLTRTVLCNGNLEPSLSMFFTNRDHIVRWAWRNPPRKRPEGGGGYGLPRGSERRAVNLPTRRRSMAGGPTPRSHSREGHTV